MAQAKSPALIYAEAHSLCHDISHCNPKEHIVNKCNSCKRYAAHLQLHYNQEKFKDGLYSYFSDPETTCVQKNYQYYRPIK